MKATKKALALVLAAIPVFSAVGCAGGTGTGSGGKTVIKVTSYLGGFGTDWLDEAAKRFEAENKDVRLNISHTKTTNVSTISSSAQDLYFVNDGDLPPTLAQKGLVADINDIVTEKFDTRNGEPISIDDKIEESYKCMLKGNTKSGESHYFALPYATYASGISYDIDFFTTNNCYIAAEDETDVHTVTSYGTSVNFVNSATAKKSVGQDGVAGTYDDGLPVSMQEFLVLCDYIKNECSTSPLHYAGAQKAYLNGLINALEISLGGKDYANSLLNFTGTVECVVMEKEHNEWQVQTEPKTLFSGSASGAQVPQVYDAELSDEKAYLTTQTSARYYANAFLYTLLKDSYFSDRSQSDSNNLTGQAEFLKSGYGTMETFAMFIEGSYWYTEAVENEMTSAIDTVTNIGWMPLPITVNASDSAEGKKSVIVVDGSSFCFINANTERNKPKVFEATKKFLQFLYSDDELSKYTGSSGCYKRALTYEAKAEDMENVTPFAKNVLKAFDASDVVQFASSNKTFLAYSGNLWGSNSRKVMPELRENADSTTTKHVSSIMQSFLLGYDLEKVYNSTVLDATHFSVK